MNAKNPYMRLFHRITISLTDDEMNLIEELRREGGDSVSKIFRDAIQLYYNLFKASKVAGVDFNKYFRNIDRLASHIHGVEQRQFAIIDRDFYRVLLRKLQEKVEPETMEKDEEFKLAISGVAKLFKVTRSGWDEFSDDEKVKEILSTLEFAGAGSYSKIGDGEYIFNTYPEGTTLTKVILSHLLSSAGIKAEIDYSPGKIFIKL